MKKLKLVTAFQLGVAAFLAVCLVPVKTYAQSTVRTIKQSQVSGSTAKLQKNSSVEWLRRINFVL